MEKKFELEYRIPDTEVPILVVDLRVSLFSMLYKALKYEGLWTEQDLLDMWATKFNFPIFPWLPQRYQIIVVDDTKYADGTYWRTRYLKKLPDEYPKYKGNRKPEDRPELYYRLHEAGVKYAQTQGYTYLSRLGYEADDFAGAIAKSRIQSDASSAERDVLLFTVDSDWGQLVSDKHRILFYYSNLPCWSSALRDERWILRWFEEKQGITLGDVKNIVSYKSECGDTADNLRPGSPEGVIDLMEPAKKLPNCDHKKIAKALNTVRVDTNPALALKAQLRLNRKMYDAELPQI